MSKVVTEVATQDQVELKVKEKIFAVNNSGQKISNLLNMFIYILWNLLGHVCSVMQCDTEFM